jgi:hypothetical protein
VGRPPLDYTPVIFQIGDLRLHPEHDADLIAYLSNVKPRHRIQAIKSAMRAGSLAAVAPDQNSDDEDLTDAASAFI